MKPELRSDPASLVVGIDADDTLWHNETVFEKIHERYRALLARYHDAETVDRTLFATEMRNLELYGYGVKGFTLSAIETAIALTDGKIGTSEIAQIIEFGRQMLTHPVELLPEVGETLVRLASTYLLLLITKGDLRDQQRKVTRSGLENYFHAVEIVSEKDEAAYAAVLSKHGIPAQRFVMVGNSLKSDILPVLGLGGRAIYIPYMLTWAAEHVPERPSQNGRYFELAAFAQLPALLARIQ